MRRAPGLLLGLIGATGAGYLWLSPDRDQVATEKLVTLVRIAAEGTRTIANATPPRSDREQPRVFSSREPLSAEPAQPAASPQRVVRVAETPVAAAPRAQPIPTAAAAMVSQPKPITVPEAPPRRLASVKPGDEEARRALSKSIQAELRRVGCFEGDMDGQWSSTTRRSMKTFTDRINATLPVDEPDYILLTLLQGHAAKACGPGCPAGQVPSNDGRCQPRAVIAQADRKVERRVIGDATQQASPAAKEPLPGRMAAGAPVPTAPSQSQIEVARHQQEAKAEEARRQQHLVLQQRQARLETEQRDRAALEARLKTEAAAEEARRKQLVIDQQRLARADADRQAQARAAEDARIKTAAAAEETRRNQLVTDQQRLAKADADRQAQARAAEDARMKLLAAAEDARRLQLVIEQQRQTRLDAERQAQLQAQARAAEETRLKAEVAETRRRNELALLEAQRAATARQVATAAPVAAERAPAPTAAQPQQIAALAPLVAAPPVAQQPAVEPQAEPRIGTIPAVIPPAVAVPQPGPVRRQIERRASVPPQDNGPAPRFVRKFVPPPSYVVGRTVTAPPSAPRPTRVYVQAAPSLRSGLFANISRNAP